ncbi:MAG: hypothetical protein ABEI86_04520 [Halobacteriaceae archaeon]
MSGLLPYALIALTWCFLGIVASAFLPGIRSKSNISGHEEDEYMLIAMITHPIGLLSIGLALASLFSIPYTGTQMNGGFLIGGLVGGLVVGVLVASLLGSSLYRFIRPSLSPLIDGSK